MYELTILTGFSAAHNLREYDGACERLHGHNWRVEVCVKGPELNELDMLVDFSVLKAEASKVMEYLDHVHLNKIEPFDTINPSAENIARFIYGKLSKTLNCEAFSVSLVKVWESEGAAASYYE